MSVSLPELDAALPGLACKIRVLDALAWPVGVEEDFLEHWLSLIHISEPTRPY